MTQTRYTPEEAAAELGCTREHLYRLMPSFKSFQNRASSGKMEAHLNRLAPALFAPTEGRDTEGVTSMLSYHTLLPLADRLNLPTPVPYTNWSYVRSMVYVRDQGCCVVCERFVQLYEYECGHLQDRVTGGQPSPDNCIVMCKRCNSRKPFHDTKADALAWIENAKKYGMFPTKAARNPHARRSVPVDKVYMRQRTYRGHHYFIARLITDRNQRFVERWCRTEEEALQQMEALRAMRQTYHE